MGQGVRTMIKTIGSRSDPNQQAKTQERKIKQQKGYNSTWHGKYSLGLGTQTWHGAHKNMEYRIKHVENIDPSTTAFENIYIDIQAKKHTCRHVETQHIDMEEHESKHISMYGCRSKHEALQKAYEHVDPSKEQPITPYKHANM